MGVLYCREKDSCFDSLIQECVRVFLDRREGTLRHLHADFSRLQTPDEKVTSSLPSSLSLLSLSLLSLSLVKMV